MSDGEDHASRSPTGEAPHGADALSARNEREAALALHEAIRAILEAPSVPAMAVAVTRALRAALGADVAYVALTDSSESGGCETPRVLAVGAVDGDSRLVRPVGALLEEDGTERWAIAHPMPILVPGARNLAGLRKPTPPGANGIVVSLGPPGVAVAVLRGPLEDGALAMATVISSVAQSTWTAIGGMARGSHVLESGVPSRGGRRTARLQSLLQLQRALAEGVLEDAFPSFASGLAEEVEFEIAYVGALPPAGAPRSSVDRFEVVASFTALPQSNEGELPVSALAPGSTPQAPQFGAPPLAAAVEVAPDIGAYVAYEGTPLAKILRSGRARSSGPTFLTGDEAAALSARAVSAVVVPLVVHDAVLGVLVLVSARDGLDREALGADGSWLLGAIAEPLAFALQNAVLFARLRNAMRDWEKTFDVMDAYVFITDEVGSVRRANWALARALSTTPNALVGRIAKSLFPGQEIPIPNDLPRTSLTGPGGEPLRASAVALPGGGTVVVMHDARAGSFRSHSRMAALTRTTTDSVGHARGRVLVVDDEPSILRAVTRTLARSHDVLTATDGDEALDLIRRENGLFDVVMSDIQMARLGGIELYHSVEREFPSLSSRFLFMTGGVFGPATEQFLGGLNERVLRKPFDPDALRRAIDQHVAIARVA